MLSSSSSEEEDERPVRLPMGAKEGSTKESSQVINIRIVRAILARSRRWEIEAKSSEIQLRDDLRLIIQVKWMVR